MHDNEKKTSLIVFLLILTVYSALFFLRLNNPQWMVNGDTLNSFTMFSYHYSGIARGEYPIWNPLVRAGEPEVVQQALQLASPTSNIPVVVSSLLGVQDTLLVFSIYIFITLILYLVGIYRLISCWTKNHYAALFASIIAIGSSTVLWYVYHISFVLIIHMIPWMLYSLTRYLQVYRFRYLVMFTLAFSIALYSYEFVMGLAYLLFFLSAVLIFYFKKIPEEFQEAKRVSLWHLIAFVSLLTIVSFPVLLMFIELNLKLLPISRVSNITLTDKFTLEYLIATPRMMGRYLFSPSALVSMFSGATYEQDFNFLRQFIGPVALPFAAIAIFSRNRLALCIAFSGFFISLLSISFPFVRILYDIPPFNLIRAGHFLLQFLTFSIVVLAGFGLDKLMKSDAAFLRKVFITVLSIEFLSIVCFYLPAVLSLVTSKISWIASLFTFIVILVMLLIIKMWPRRTIQIPFIFLAFAVALTSSIYLNKFTLLGGSIAKDPDILMLRKRMDHSLKFSYVRPDTIETINAKSLKEMDTETGDDEFSSYVTLRDNSFKTKGGSAGRTGQSSFPILKSYYRFRLLPGNEILLRKKFFFFEKCYVSSEGKDMMALKHNPDLLKNMIEKSICIAENVNDHSLIYASGQFAPSEILNFPSSRRNNNLMVKERKYNSNSAIFTINAGSAGIFTYTDLWDEGWHVRLDGKPIPLIKVFHTFKGVAIEPGEHVIEFFYLNKILVSIVVMNIAFILCLIGLLSYLSVECYKNYGHRR